MHCQRLISVLGFVFTIFPIAHSVLAEDAVKVMTWNLEWFYDDDSGDNHSKLAKEQSAPTRDDWDWKRDGIARSIATVSPTIAAFQEVENRRVMWYLSRAIDRDHNQKYQELAVESRDFFTEQDVAYLVRQPAEVTSQTVFNLSGAERKNDLYSDVSKHLMGTFEIRHGDAVEQIAIINLHLRARAEAVKLRVRQARSVHLWIADLIKAGKNVIVLGDMNTEQRDETAAPDSDMGILAGRHTPTPDDDLTDLLVRLPRSQRQTHLLEDRQFDRILCSRSLMTDAPGKRDLVFQSVAVHRDLAIHAEPDTPQGHWDDYWAVAPNQRDLSDHYPVVATFVWK